jgi:hypothetical protein
MVQDVNTRRGIDEATMQADYPKAWAYLKHFESELRSRAAFRRYFTRKQGNKVIETGPFYSMFDVGGYTLAPWKVAWKEIATELTCGVLGPPRDGESQIPIPLHKLMIVPCKSGAEAYYLCGVLNSVCARLFAKAYMVETQLSTHVLENIDVPRFSESNKLHQKIAELSLEAHKKCRNALPVGELEEEINKLSARLWSISDEELDDIKYCHGELMKSDLALRDDEAEEDNDDEE